MKNTLRLYRILTPAYQSRPFYGICLFGLIVAQLLLSYGFAENEEITFRSFCYCAYFLFIAFMMMYNFLNNNMFINETKRKNNMRLCILQMYNPKDIFIKGIIVNNLFTAILYFLCSVVAMSIMALFNGFYLELLMPTLWASSMACIAGIYFNIAMSNDKGTIGGIIALLYVLIFFLSSMIIDITSLNNEILHFITQSYSLFALVPLMVIMIGVAYYFGIYCYNTRKDERRKQARYLKI